MSYFNDYKNERYHDANLIALISYMASKRSSAAAIRGLIPEAFDTGEYVSGRTKRDYDVHLEFENAVICVETKVDSNENEYAEGLIIYQTQRIYDRYKSMYSKATYFLYVTYGASEFYIKKNEEGLFSTGPYSSNFKHVTLAQIIAMTEHSGVLVETSYSALNEWYGYLKYEQARRRKYTEMLEKIAEFRKLYLDQSGLTDWSNNRINICVPEISLSFYSSMATAWNASDYRQRLGGVSVYPIGRMGKVNDAVLNFRELWDKNTSTMDGIVTSGNAFYFEFNEDFNLHLKCVATSETESRIHLIHDFVNDHRVQLHLSHKCHSTPERYKQGAYVLYEWDVGVLDNVADPSIVFPNIAEAIENALSVIK